MKSIEIKRYQPAHKKQWDDFIKTSQADCLLFYRDFMEYHADRFEDHSLVFEDHKGWLAVFPAHLSGKCLVSHGGLTFGGIVTRERCCWKDHVGLMKALQEYILQQKFKSICLKSLPFFYQKRYNGETDFLFYQNGAKIIRRDLNYLIDFREPLVLNKTKNQIYKKGLSKNFKIEAETDFKYFWTELLQPTLKNKYGASPTHTIIEIQKLKNLFPTQIKLFTLYFNDKMLAGIVIFENAKVVKSQYTAVNDMGKKICALDHLYIFLIKKYQQEGFRYFDLGHVNTHKLPIVNNTLIQYKEGLGARPYNLDTYTIDLQ